MSRPSWHEVFIEMLESIAKRSMCLKIRTAAMIVHDTQVLAIGYNGTFSKFTECSDVWRAEHKKLNITEDFNEWLTTDDFKIRHREWSKIHEIHAEANALKWISRANVAGCIMYTLYSPCDACAKDIIAHGIKTIYYKHMYSHGHNALEILNKASVLCIQIK